MLRTFGMLRLQEIILFFKFHLWLELHVLGGSQLDANLLFFLFNDVHVLHFRKWKTGRIQFLILTEYHFVILFLQKLVLESNRLGQLRLLLPPDFIELQALEDSLVVPVLLNPVNRLILNLFWLWLWYQSFFLFY